MDVLAVWNYFEIIVTGLGVLGGSFALAMGFRGIVNRRETPIYVAGFAVGLTGVVLNGAFFLKNLLESTAYLTIP